MTVEDDAEPVEDVAAPVEDVAPKTVMKSKILLLSLMFVIKKQMFVVQTSLFLKMAVPEPLCERWLYTHVQLTACLQSVLCTLIGHRLTLLSTVSKNHGMKSHP